MIQGEWFVERQTEGYRTQWRVRRVLHEERSPYQSIRIVETEDFGRALILDDCMQTTAGDEFIYHEMIAHVPLVTHPRPEHVLIIGGGDGGTAREVLKHPTVRRVDVVEIDQAVVNACRQYLPETAAAFGQARVHLHIGDGLAWVRQCQGEYDVILVDSSDPEGPAQGLFNEAFYQSVHSALRPGGLFVCQALSPFFHQELIQQIYGVVSRHFPITLPYLTVVPTYPSGLHCFMLGSREHHPLRSNMRTVPVKTRWYTPEIHRAAFTLPPTFSRLLVQGEARRLSG